MSVLKVWNKRNRRKSVSSLLIVLMLLSMLPTGVLPAQVVSASINPAVAEYDLAASADVSTTITWNDAASVVSVVYDGTPLAEAVYGVIYIDSTTSTLTIRNDFFAGLAPAVAAGKQMPFTVNFNAGDPVTFTVTLINATPPVVTGTIAGQVTGPDGVGVPNAGVDVRSQSTGAWAGWVQTDANGNYTTTGLAPGTYELEVRPPQGVTLAQARISGIVVTAGVTTIRDVTLAAGGLISGRVTGPDGVGVPNASVNVWIPATGAGGWAQTDANGNYTTTGLAPGIYELEVRPPQGVTLAQFRISGIEVTAGATTKRDVTLVTGGLISGRVTGPDGVGVPNASVNVWIPATGAGGWAQTDANGNYTTTGLAPGIYELEVRPPQGATLAQFRISGIEVTAGATTKRDVTLVTGGLISGRVTGPDGNGVPNTSISVRNQATDAWAWAQTDANGIYTTTGLAQGIYDMWVWPSQGVNLVPVRITSIVVTAGAITTVDVSLKVAGIISGKVIGPDGNGVPNTSISVRNQATGAWDWAQTDANGIYTTTGLAQGTYDMWVRPSQGVNLVPARIAGIVVTAGVTTTVDVSLEVGGIIAGKVTGSDGVGVSNASIEVWVQATGAWAGSASADADGNYTIAGLASGSYEIEVRPPWGVNLVPVRITGKVVAAGVTTTVDVSLEVGGIISGRVTGPDGVGVPNASVNVWIPATGAGGWAQTDANGNYTTTGLAPGIYELEVRPSQGVNLVPARIAGIEVTAGVTTIRDVTLVAGGLISGRVTGPDGVGVPNASVNVWIPATGAWAGWAQTDANGNYTTTGLAPGTYELEVRSPQGVTLAPARIFGIEVTAGVTTIRDVILVAGGLISGRVTGPDGAGVPNASVNVWIPATGAWAGSAQTDANGNYTTTGLAPGTYDMSVWPSQGVNLLPARITSIEVTAGATAIRDVTLVAGGLISGRVTGPDGAGVPNVSISVRNQATGASGWAQTDANGNYTTTDLTPGIYNMWVWPSQGANLLPTRINSIAVAAGDTTTLDVTLLAHGIISGRVTDPDGAGVPNANVSAWDPTTGTSGWVQTDAEGNYSITGLAPGIYDMSVSAPHGVNLVPASITSIVVVAGENTTVDVLLEVGGIISGRVTDPDASGVPNASIFVWDQFTGAWVGGAQTDVNGNYTIAGLAPGTYDIGVRPSQGVNLVPIRISGIVVTAGQETVLEPIELFPHGAISGTVTDGVYGVSGATVEVAWEDIYGDWLIYGRVLTGTDGGFTLSDIPPGTYDIQVIPPPGDPYLQPTVVNGVTVTSGATTELLVPIVLLLGGAITGRVTGPDGEGVPYVNIGVLEAADGKPRSWAQTDANGNYTTAGLAPGVYELWVRPPHGVYLMPVHITGIEVAADVTTVVNVSLTIAVPVTFPDPNLESAIREALGIEPGVDIYSSDLARLESLDASSRGISDLTGLEYCTNLWLLFLGENKITDISPLAELASLTRLSLEGNQITDLSLLTGLTRLMSLNLSSNQITDLSPLDVLTNLNWLYLWGNQITDLSPLGELTNLKKLYLGNNQITNISQLAGLTNLTELGLGVNQITDLSPLAVLTNLTWLELWNNQITNISPLVGLTSLTGFQLMNNHITDLSPLVESESLSQGDWVDILGNPLSAESLSTHIPLLVSRGVQVYYDAPQVVPVTGVTVSPPAATINVGATEQLAAAVAPAEATNQDVTWASSNTAVATVSDTGLVTGVEVGSATITVTTADGGFTVSSLITVVPHIAGIAETGISQSLDDNGIVVLPVKVVRVKDPTGTTVDMPGGLGDFEATVTSPDGGIQLLAVRGTDYFPEVAFAPVTGEIAASVAPLPRQPENTEVARLVPRLTGSAENSYTLTVAFQEIVAAETGVNVLEEQTNSLTFRRGDANGDDRVNIVDAMFVAQKVVGNRGLDTVNALNAASVRHDGPNGDSISIVDAMFIAQYVVGLRDASYNLAQ